MGLQKVKYHIRNADLANEFIRVEGRIMDPVRQELGTVLKKVYYVDQAGKTITLGLYWKGPVPIYRVRIREEALLRSMTNNNLVSITYG
ncbi:hypothetical protein SCBWM1_gp45 [Synechococcus phage S-CBWM1]|uniref:Uncharacterized protein n=1 Tax=Synechococcus phage S-CBWM1 TaxID=2053653 RepID=A0A3G1L3H3_9CAUD|nr:hypothetical protein HOU61_gp152 [Synechococcus phage S-CBWM1]ATW62729.1 hypothetical protein SCBWM1_gp45 [Synechococcus phage S-CBWM1]